MAPSLILFRVTMVVFPAKVRFYVETFCWWWKNHNRQLYSISGNSFIALHLLLEKEGGCANATACVWRESVFAFHCVGPTDPTQDFGIGCKYLNPLSHLASMYSILLCWLEPKTNQKRKK